MKKLTPVKFNYNRIPSKTEKERESYLIKDGLISQAKGGATKLKHDYTVTLEEAKDIYNRIVESINPKEGESITGLTIDLTEYEEYKENGEPIFSSCDLSEVKTATYNDKLNRLIIWKNGLPIYSNYNGLIETDQAALADTLL